MSFASATADEISRTASDMLRVLGVPDADARLVADTLVQADLWGHQSHGLLRLPWYVDRIRSGVMNPVTMPELIVDVGAVEVIDGHDGVGQVLAARAATDAIQRAERFGVGAVAVRNSNHFGTAAYFTRMAPPEGCIGILTSNSSPAMVPWGGSEKMVGSNPWSIAAPGGKSGPVVMDIANTAVARGKIYLAIQNGSTIPIGWAVDEDGRPTTDPQAALRGAVLPMAEHKGYVVSVMMDILSGVLTGSSFGTQVNGPYQAELRSGCGHLFIALRIAAFIDPSEFDRRVDQLITELKDVPMADGSESVFYPGELESRAEAEHRRTGLVLPPKTVEHLERLARELEVPPPSPCGSELSA